MSSDLTASGGFCAPVSPLYDIQSPYVFTFPRPRRWRDRVRNWFKWVPEWWSPLGHNPVRVRDLIPKLSVARGPIRFL